MLSLWCDFYAPLFFIAVTTVDSGSKALEFLGLYEDDQSSPESPSVSPSNQQVLRLIDWWILLFFNVWDSQSFFIFFLISHNFSFLGF